MIDEDKRQARANMLKKKSDDQQNKAMMDEAMGGIDSGQQPVAQQQAGQMDTPAAPETQSAANKFFSPQAIWKDKRADRAANNVQPKQINLPSARDMGAGTRNFVAGAANWGKDMMNRANNTVRNTSPVREMYGLVNGVSDFVGGFSGDSGQNVAQAGQQGTKPSITSKMDQPLNLNRNAPRFEMPNNGANFQLPGYNPGQRTGMNRVVATQPNPVSQRTATSNPNAQVKPGMQFSNKYDQETYDRQGLRQSLRSPNPSIAHTLMQGDDGKYMIRETMNGGPGAPTARQPINPALWSGTQEALIETNKANAAYNTQRMAQWTGRNTQWAAQEGIPLQESQIENNEASTLERRTAADNNMLDFSQGKKVAEIQQQIGETADEAERARLMQQLQAYSFMNGNTTANAQQEKPFKIIETEEEYTNEDGKLSMRPAQYAIYNDGTRKKVTDRDGGGQGGEGGFEKPTQASIEKLKNNPSLKDAFLKRFGYLPE